MKKFSYHKPRSLEQAFGLLSRHKEDAAVLAGGTDLLVEMKRRIKAPSHVIDIKALSFLDGVAANPDGSLRVGPLTTLQALSRSPLLGNGWSLLAQAASQVGSLQVRNRATLGGNICHASPGGDTLPALLCLNAQVKLARRGSERNLAIQDFFLGPGKCALQPDELLTEIFLPPSPSGSRGVYKKFSLRRAMDLAVVGVAVLGVLDPSRKVFKDLRIGLGAVAPTPLRARKAEKILINAEINEDLVRQASGLASEEAIPLSDLRGSEWYRREIIRHLAEEAIKEIIAERMKQ
jgi:carbon-monoxide dehydrogenase medium subunit